MTVLDNNEFLEKASTLLAPDQYYNISQKRLSYKKGEEIEGKAAADPAEQYPILIRLTDGKSSKKEGKANRIKLSTVVAPADFDQFWTRWVNVLKGGFSGLKKQKKKSKKRAKKQKAAL